MTIVPPFGPPTLTKPEARPGTAGASPVPWAQPAGTFSAMPEAEIGTAAPGVADGVGVTDAAAFLSPPPPPPSARAATTPTTTMPPTIAAGTIHLGRPPSPDGAFGCLGAFFGGSGRSVCGIIVSITTGCGVGSGVWTGGAAKGCGVTGAGAGAAASTGAGVGAGWSDGGRDGGGAM